MTGGQTYTISDLRFPPLCETSFKNDYGSYKNIIIDGGDTGAYESYDDDDGCDAAPPSPRVYLDVRVPDDSRNRVFRQMFFLTVIILRGLKADHFLRGWI